jgi:uncharacterized membrane protein YbhN (UPF0104 family)
MPQGTKVLYWQQMKRHLKTAIALAILAATLGAFIYYIGKNPAVVDKLKDLPPGTLVLILALDAVAFGCFVLVTRASLLLYGKRMGRQENVLFNAYSALINFFGPGQSGPLFRGAYLKKRHGLGVKQYVFATLIYYGFFGVISLLFVMAGTRPWYETAMVVTAATLASVSIMRRYKQRAKIGAAKLDVPHIGMIGAAALGQLLLMVAIYGVELHAAGANPSFSQTLSYTGIANLTVFVALTPGAIGIREAFLLFSEKLHHIGDQAIVAANVMDRGIYLVFLGILFLLVIGLHAKKKLQVSQLGDQPEEKAQAEK